MLQQGVWLLPQVLQSCNNDANVRSCNYVARLFFYAVKASSRQGAKRAQRRQEGAKTPSFPAGYGTRRTTYPPLAGVARSAGGGPAKKDAKFSRRLWHEKDHVSPAGGGGAQRRGWTRKEEVRNMLFSGISLKALSICSGISSAYTSPMRELCLAYTRTCQVIDS